MDSEKTAPNNVIEMIDRPHIVDLENTPKGIISESLENVPLIYPSVNYLIYFKRTLQHLFLTLLFDWTNIITSPINFLLTFVFFPLVAIVLFLLEIILRFISFMKWDVNDDERIKALDEPPNKYRKGFDLNSAQFLLYLSAILQERDEKKVTEAYRMISDLKKSLKKDKNPDDEQKIRKIYEILKKSESGIHKQLEEFDIKFTSLSELNTLGGPYAGMFWSDKGNFIVIAIKGTTPTNFNEWLTNATFQRMDARSYLFGEVHEGFYTQLFPADEYDSIRVDRMCPATRIIDAVRIKAESIRKRNGENNHKTPEDTPLVNVYVTGHSLGGALATLLYARLMKSPQSLGKDCLLRDGTVFASLSIGDSDFSAEFSSLSNKSNDEYKTLWRIVCDNDIAPRVPIGHHHPKLRRYTKKIHVMNYFHVGNEVRFYQDGSTPSSMNNIFTDDKELIFIERGLSWKDWRGLFGFYDPFDHAKHDKKATFERKLDDKLYSYEKFLIGPLSPFRNHMSHRYFAALEKSREFFENNDVNFKDKHVPGENIV
ncbi:Alpha/Beta hydrolase protein [Rhizophagus diaphanus]|nr:Alpha/Beta hydrolase protein [Rhizophagus diaphanus] [Rhizophagus sp. MUCL 43196]